MKYGPHHVSFPSGDKPMNDQVRLETIFSRHGFADFRAIDPQLIEIAQLVRMKVHVWLRRVRTQRCVCDYSTIADQLEGGKPAEAVAFHFAHTCVI